MTTCWIYYVFVSIAKLLIYCHCHCLTGAGWLATRLSLCYRRARFLTEITLYIQTRYYHGSRKSKNGVILKRDLAVSQSEDDIYKYGHVSNDRRSRCRYMRQTTWGIYAYFSCGVQLLCGKVGELWKEWFHWRLYKRIRSSTFGYHSPGRNNPSRGGALFYCASMDYCHRDIYWIYAHV